MHKYTAPAVRFEHILNERRRVRSVMLKIYYLKFDRRSLLRKASTERCVCDATHTHTAHTHNMTNGAKVRGKYLDIRRYCYFICFNVCCSVLIESIVVYGFMRFLVDGDQASRTSSSDGFSIRSFALSHLICVRLLLQPVAVESPEMLSLCCHSKLRYLDHRAAYIAFIPSSHSERQQKSRYVAANVEFYLSHFDRNFQLKYIVRIWLDGFTVCSRTLLLFRSALQMRLLCGVTHISNPFGCDFRFHSDLMTTKFYEPCKYLVIIIRSNNTLNSSQIVSTRDSRAPTSCRENTLHS